MDVNPTKEKKLTNIRTHAHDEALRLTPPRPLTLEVGARVHRGRRARRGDPAVDPAAQAAALAARPAARGGSSGGPAPAPRNRPPSADTTACKVHAMRRRGHRTSRSAASASSPRAGCVARARRAAAACRRRDRPAARTCAPTHQRPAHRPDLERPQAAAVHDQILNYGAGPFEVRGHRSSTSQPFAIDQVIYRTRRHDASHPHGGAARATPATGTTTITSSGWRTTTCGRRGERCATARSASASSTRLRATCRCRGAPRTAATANRAAGHGHADVAPAPGSRSAGATSTRGTSPTSGSTSPGCRPARTRCATPSTCRRRSLESSETNNCSYVRLSISGSTVRVAQPRLDVRRTTTARRRTPRTPRGA